MPLMSADAFEGTSLRAGEYAGSSLIVFTDARKRMCAPCASLNETLSSDDFMALHATWRAEGLLRVGKVHCTNPKKPENAELCESFGIGGDTPDAAGYPNIRWFKGSAEAGGYDGERSVEGFRAWAASKKESGEL